MTKPIPFPHRDHTEPYNKTVPAPPDLTVDGPHHYQPDRDLAERLNASVRLAATDETDREALVRMLLERPRSLTDKQRQYWHDKRVRTAAKAATS